MYLPSIRQGTFLASLLLTIGPTNAANSNNIVKVADLFHGGDCPDCHRFDGIGGISGGGATSRLLVEYPEDAQLEILDFLFLPNFGASLHILKVEIGGDSQSTDGSESTHMHSQDDLNFHRGYEWWILKEDKKRKPNIKTTWIWTLKWVQGAREVHGIEIDYLGVWNEIGTSRECLLAVSKVLDDHEFSHIQLVSNDGAPQGFLPQLVNDTKYRGVVDILGFHYPHDDAKEDWELANSSHKPIWAAEESSSYDDLNGACCWARVIASHYVLNNMTANVMWNLLASYSHGTNWCGSSMLTAVQPWTGMKHNPNKISLR